MTELATPSEPELTMRVAAPLGVVEQVAQSRVEQSLFGRLEPVCIGRYVLLQHIATGGFGEVHAAFDPKLDRRVALKLLTRTDASAATRIVREAQAIARVAHPNVVAVFDFGTFADMRGAEQVYVAMEYVEGTTLREWVTAQSRTWSEVLPVLLGAGRGLEAVHRAGVVHHDFKPSNVLVGDDGRARVVDFGLARFVASRPDEAPDRSVVIRGEDSPFEIAGTPAYMAPEQHRGGATDARSDMFAFAVTAFEMLYGVRPFAGATTRELFDAKTRGVPVDAPHRGAPPRLRAVLRRALAADPGARYASMTDLLAALVARPGRRWLVAAAIAIAASGGGWWAARRSEQVEQQASEIDERARAAHEAAARALYVYPPAEAVDARTAYLEVRDLEARGLPAADARARTLRIEFADTLARLGDRYWDAPGGRSFAHDYYLEALVFVPEHPRAIERAAVSPGWVLAIEQQAVTQSFTSAQLAATAPLRALAIEDPEARGNAVREVLAMASPPASVRAELERFVTEREPGLSSAAPIVAAREGASDPEESVAAPSLPPSDAESGGQGPPPSATAESPTETPVPSAAGVEAPVRVDAQAARSEVARGKGHVDRGEWKQAEQAFLRALGHDRRSVAALAGLAALHFDQRAYRKAGEFARRAIDLAPRDPRNHILAGDAAFGLRSYSSARRYYGAAAGLGSDEAQRRLETLADVLGTESAP